MKKETKEEKNDLIRTLDRLYACRDLEISSLWQRSIFLSVFLVLCFTGYGYLLIKIVDSTYDESKLFYLHIIAIALSGISMLFSLLWIMMAKGSKAWYEVYETAISRFEDKYCRRIRLPEKYIMGEMTLPSKKRNNCIFSTKAGAYSVSKINVFIGIACFVIWGIITVVHLNFTFIIYFNITFIPIWLCLICAFYFIFAVFLIIFAAQEICRSEHLMK